MPTTLLLPECLHMYIFFSDRLSCNHFLRLSMARQRHSNLLYRYFNLYTSKIEVPSKTLQLFYYAFSIFFPRCIHCSVENGSKSQKSHICNAKREIKEDSSMVHELINEESLRNLIGENITSVLKNTAHHPSPGFCRAF